MKNEEIVKVLLKELHIPFTLGYVRELFNEMPYSESLWAIHKVLERYNIKNTSYRINDKHDISLIRLPFIAETDSGFVIVSNILNDEITYKQSNAIQKCHKMDFISKWTGVVLEFSSNIEAEEPSFERHNRIERSIMYVRILVVLCFLVLFGGSILHCTKSSNCSLIIISILLNSIGLGLSYLLLNKQLHISNKVARQLCGLFPKGNCSEIGNDNVRVIGFWTLCEIGLTYFSLNIIALIAFPIVMIQIMPVLSVFTLPFTIWSIIYQKIRLKEWCPLCIYVIIVLWMQFLVYLCMGVFYVIQFNLDLLEKCSIIIGCYIIFAYIIKHYTSLLHNLQDLRNKYKDLLNLKYNVSYWTMLLHSNKHYVLEDVSTIVVNEGDDNKPQITVIANPYCGPCARMHSRLEALKKRDFRIQYVFVAFHPRQMEVLRHFVMVYIADGDKFWEYLTNWYQMGMFSGDEGLCANQEKVNDVLEIEKIVQSQKNGLKIQE